MPVTFSSRQQRRLGLLALVLMLGLGVGWMFHTLWDAQVASETEPPVAALASPAALSADERRQIEIYQQVSPAVVNITRTTVALDGFFNTVPQQGVGSGVLITHTGYIVTNAHVVENANLLEVTIPNDPQPYPARIVGGDASYDFALLKIEPRSGQRFQTVLVGESASLQVGQKVLAIGNPFGLKNTLTTGIVSSLGRRLEARNGRLMENIIQTDAAINPGNSGGALLDSSGRLVGINTAIFSPSGASSGIGFAIPVDSIMRLANDLIQYGRIIRPYMGLTIGLEVTPRVARILGLPVSNGLMVAQVEPGSPAAQAGLVGGSRAIPTARGQLLIGGDLIVQVDSRRIESVDDFLNYVDAKRPGDVVTLKVVRDGVALEKRLKLAQRPAGWNS